MVSVPASFMKFKKRINLNVCLPEVQFEIFCCLRTAESQINTARFFLFGIYDVKTLCETLLVQSKGDPFKERMQLFALWAFLDL